MNHHDLIIITQSEAPDMGILDSLTRKGFKYLIMSDIKAIKDSIQSLYEPILIAYSAAESGQKEFFKKIIRQPELRNYPIAALAYDLSGLEAELNNIFPLAIATRNPAEAAKIIEAVRFLERNYREVRLGIPAEEISKEKEPEPVFSAKDVTEGIQFTKDLFSSLKKLHNIPAGLGGEALTEILSGRSNKILACEMPADNQLRNFCETFLSSLNIQSRKAIERVNCVTKLIMDPLELDSEIFDLGLTASFLYAQAFAGSSRNLLTKDYAFKGGIIIRKELCSAIKDSALNIGSDLANRDLNHIIASVARIIGNEGELGNNQFSIVASAIAQADLMNRKCFQPLFWNFRAAQRIIKAIRIGKLKLVHPAVNCITLKLISEALSSPANRKVMTSVSPYGNQELEGSVIVSKESLVDLPELQAGMKLSRPLTTEDGKEVLVQDIILDDDLISRIWQFSGLCPLEKVVVKRPA